MTSIDTSVDFKGGRANPSWTTQYKLADHDATLPNKVQGWHLFRRAGLTGEQRQLVTAQAPGMERNKVQGKKPSFSCWVRITRR
jgi:hypothetical protein